MPLNRAVPVALIVNELVTNAIKYAFGNASGTILVDFEIARHHGEGCISVQDDGIGFTEEARRQQGMGIRIMNYRAGLIGGTLKIGPAETGGTIVTCTLPREN